MCNLNATNASRTLDRKSSSKEPEGRPGPGSDSGTSYSLALPLGQLVEVTYQYELRGRKAYVFFLGNGLPYQLTISEAGTKMMVEAFE